MMSVTQLQEELTTVDALLHLLQREYDILKARDLPALEQVVAEKQRCVDRLQDQIAARLGNLREHGFAADAQGMAAYLNRLPPADQIAATRLWTELEQAAVQLRNQNDINGAVIAAGRSHIERSLAILSGRDSLDFLYDQGTRKVFGGGQRSPIAKV